jgi:hypothetical protein
MKGSESAPYIPLREDRGVGEKVQLSTLNIGGSKKLKGCSWSIQKKPQKLWFVYSVFQSIEISRVDDIFYLQQFYLQSSTFSHSTFSLSTFGHFTYCHSTVGHFTSGYGFNTILL